MEKFPQHNVVNSGTKICTRKQEKQTKILAASILVLKLGGCTFFSISQNVYK